MFALCCDIKIGTARFSSVNSVTVKRSLHSLSATAIIKVPITAVVKQNGQPPAYSEIRQLIQVNQEVTIKLGYDGKLNTEFTGWVKQINYKMPLEIECEDEYYSLRSIDCKFDKEKSTLEDFLKALLPSIKLAEFPKLNLGNFIINHQSGSLVLANLKKEYGLTVYFDIEKTLHVEKLFAKPGEKAKYRLRYNVIKDDELRYLLAKDTTLNVKAICYKGDGTMIEGQVGDKGGEQKTLYYYDVGSTDELKTLAQEEYKKFCYDGYRGKIETFLLPYCLPGMVANIDDPKYSDRNGDFHVVSTEVTFGRSGARRKIEIGAKV